MPANDNDNPFDLFAGMSDAEIERFLLDSDDSDLGELEQEPHAETPTPKVSITEASAIEQSNVEAVTQQLDTLADVLVIEKPVAKKQVVKEPIVKEPIVKELAEKEPAAKELIVEKQIVENRAVENRVEKKPAVEAPMPDLLAPKQDDTAKPATEHADKSATLNSVALSDKSLNRRPKIEDTLEAEDFLDEDDFLIGDEGLISPEQHRIALQEKEAANYSHNHAEAVNDKPNPTSNLSQNKATQNKSSQTTDIEAAPSKTALIDKPLIEDTDKTDTPTATINTEVSKAQENTSQKIEATTETPSNPALKSAEPTSFDERSASIDQKMRLFKQQMQNIAAQSDAFHALSTQMIAEVRKLQKEGDDDFSITYEQIYQLRGALLAARRAFNEVPNFYDLVEQAWENDLYTAQMSRTHR